jgi:hypothetical protein
MRHLACTILLLAAGLTLLSCSDRSRRNPLDPHAGPQVLDVASGPSAVAANAQVTVQWDYAYFDDVLGYQLYRRQAGDVFRRRPDRVLAPETTEFVDLSVTNGQAYEYRLGLLIRNQGERLLPETAAATPGTEVVWVADRVSGLVWKVAPDGRSAGFAQGRFYSIEGLDIDVGNGSCWITDRYVHGVYQLSQDSGLELYSADLERPGRLCIDPVASRGWVVDSGRNEVLWFDLPGSSHTLALRAADAHFAEPVRLAPQNGGCWIADRSLARVLYVHPNGERVIHGDIADVVALAPDAGNGVWAATDSGHRLVWLQPGGRGPYIDAPFAVASLGVDPASGRVWIVGAAEIGLLSDRGGLLQRWDGPHGGRSLALDAVHGAVWVAGESDLWKLSQEGRQLSLLQGFAGILGLSLAPTGGRPGALDSAH